MAEMTDHGKSTEPHQVEFISFRDLATWFVTCERGPDGVETFRRQQAGECNIYAFTPSPWEKATARRRFEQVTRGDH